MLRRSGLKDKTGYSNDLLIGGLNTNAEEDNTFNNAAFYE